MSDDDDLRRRMAHIDPANSLAEDLPASRVDHNLRRILDRQSGQDRRVVRKRWIVIPTIAFTIVALLAVLQNVVPGFDRPDTAQAATPPLLTATTTGLSFGDAVDEAVEKLRAKSVGEAQRTSNYEAWFLSTTVDADNAGTSVITPQEITREWNADLSGSQTVVAGTSYRPGDDGAALEASGAPQPGSLISKDTFPAGAMGIFYPDVPPQDDTSMGNYLAQFGGQDTRTDVVRLLNAISELRSEWTLDSVQQAAILRLLKTVGGLAPVGDVVDRLGRAGVAFSATSADQSHYKTVLVISEDTGAILSMETIYLGGLSLFKDITAPAVVSYIAWK